MPKTTGEDWFGTPDAARYLGVTLQTTYRGELKAYELGRVMRIRRVDLEAFLEDHQVEPGSLGHLYKSRDEEEDA